MSGFTSGMRSSASDEWTTPKWLFDELDSEFHFTLDAASTHENALCEMHYTAEDDALSKSWDGETVWLNPPYGRAIGEFMRKASEISGGGAVFASSPPAPRRSGSRSTSSARRARSASSTAGSSSGTARTRPLSRAASSFSTTGPRNGGSFMDREVRR